MKKFQEEFVVFKNPNNEYFREQSKENDLEEVKLAVRRPTHLQKQQADSEYNKQMNKLLKEGILTKERLESTVMENGVWDKEKDKKATTLAKTIVDCRDKIEKGNIKLSEAVKVAKQSINANYEYLALTMSKNNILNHSADSIAENHRFNYLVSVSTVYSNDGNHFFRDYDDYLAQENKENPVTGMAAFRLSKLLYGFEEDYRKGWPEFKFLEKYGFVNEKLEYVNKDGQLVDEDGKVIEKVEDKPPEEKKEAEFLPD